MNTRPQFIVISARFEALVQNLRRTTDPESRRVLLAQMHDLIEEMDNFTDTYLKAVGDSPSGQTQADAVRFVGEFLTRFKKPYRGDE